MFEIELPPRLYVAKFSPEFRFGFGANLLFICENLCPNNLASTHLSSLFKNLFYLCSMDEGLIELNKNWEKLSRWFEESFGMESDAESMLFMIGVQELGQGAKEFNKTQKLELMHIAICTILSADGYYEFSHLDEDAWPHFENKKKLPPLKGQQQEEFIKKALIDYFKPYFTTQKET